MAKRSDGIRKVDDIDEKEFLSILDGRATPSALPQKGNAETPVQEIKEPEEEKEDAEEKKIAPKRTYKKKKNSEYLDAFLKPRVLKQRQSVYISQDVHEFISKIVNKLGVRNMTVGAIAKILELLDYVEKTQPDFSRIDDKKFGLTLEYGAILDNFVEQYGLDDYETSVKAIEKITQFSSCEFVAHPFIIKYPDEMMAQKLVWSKHAHWGVRRLASEGCRPRLPWAIALPNLKKNPAPIIPILENLKNDPSRFVRFERCQ